MGIHPYQIFHDYEQVASRDGINWTNVLSFLASHNQTKLQCAEVRYRKLYYLKSLETLKSIILRHRILPESQCPTENLLRSAGFSVRFNINGAYIVTSPTSETQ